MIWKILFFDTCGLPLFAWLIVFVLFWSLIEASGEVENRDTYLPSMKAPGSKNIKKRRSKRK